MSLAYNHKQARPFSADTTHITKARFRASNCPTILRHELSNPTETFPSFTSPSGSDQPFATARPRTANSTLKAKFSALQSSKLMASPSSILSGRPLSGTMNSTVNFEFLQTMSKTPRDKYQDKSQIKPVKRLKMDQFHNVIYKVKQQKEVLEKEINRMEEWQKDIKANNVWNSPQNAIVNSILRLNAQANPEGNVSQYLQAEKEMRSSKRTLRPTSSQSHFVKKTPLNAKSVTDFFQEDDNTSGAIEEILSGTNNPYVLYDNNKLKITEKLNNYMDNRGTYHIIIQNTKNYLNASPEAKDTSRSFKQQKESKEVSSRVDIVEEDILGQDISEIVESHEELEDTPSNTRTQAKPELRPNTAFNQTFPDKNRPFSASVQIHTSLSPKDFNSRMTTTGQSVTSRGKSPAIHTRPQTAKQMITFQSTPLSMGLSNVGEPKQTMGSVKFVPLMMAGQKMQVGPYNQAMNKYRESTMSNSKGFNGAQEEGKANFVIKGSKSSRLMQNASVTSLNGFKEPEGSRAGSKRLLSGKNNIKASLGTQTASQQTQEVGKVNIDAGYFENFADNPVRALMKSSSSNIKRNVVEVKDNRPMSRQAHEKAF